MEKFRKEIDSIGEYNVPENALYGSQTRRSFDALKITNRPFDHEFIKSMVQFKKAEIIGNHSIGRVEDKVKDAVLESCNELLNNFDQYKEHFITDQIQGGAGTSVNMNANEVIANMATVKLGGKLGEYLVHPNDIVNMGQSTNDAFPTMGKITFINLAKVLVNKIKDLQNQLHETATHFDIVRVGKTHLQDAVPMKMSSIFTQWASSLNRDIKRIEAAIETLSFINLGATAIGTGVTQKAEAMDSLYKNICEVTGLNLKPVEDMIDGTRNTDGFVELSSAIRGFMINMSKNCNDLRLLASGPKAGFSELLLTMIQPGSSIMPGKVNPIIPESVNQIAFAIIGSDASISWASEAGQLELNVFEPVIFSKLIEMLRMAARSCDLLIEHALKGMRPNVEAIKANLDFSSAFATVFAPKYGYSKISKIVKTSMASGTSVKQGLIEGLGITEQEYEKDIHESEWWPLKK